MSILRGFDLYAQAPRNNGGNLDNLDITVIPEGMYFKQFYVGAATKLPQIAQPVRTLTGHKKSSFADLWYNRIHVLPSRLDLGSLLSNQEREIEVWNAYFVSKELTGIVEADDDGIEISGGVTAPHTFLPLVSYIYNVNVSTDGPPVIDAEYTFEFGDEIVTVPITGQRVVILPFEYENGVTEQHAWLTDVQKPITGEKRFSIRSVPRINLNVQYKLDKISNTSLRGLLYAGNERSYAVPLWHDGGYCRTDIFAGTLEVYFDTSYRRFKPDGLALLWQSDTSFEALEIDQVHSDRLTLRNPAQNTYMGASYVAPLRKALLEGKPILTKGNMGTGTARVNYKLTENYAEVLTAYPQYLGYDVLLDRTFFNEPVTDGVHKDRILLDNESGVFTSFALRTFVQEYRTQNWRVNSLQKRYELFQFLAARKGRFKAFYFPSWRDDVIVTEIIGPADTGATIIPNNYEGYELDGGKAAFILLKTGVYYFRFVNFSSYGVVDLDSALGVTVAPEDIELFCFMDLLRFDADSVTLTFIQQSASASVPLVTTR